jgi:hypothetical protein
MTPAQEFRAEGQIRHQVKVIEGFLREGVAWFVIERATDLSETQVQALQQQLEDINE